MSEKVITEPIKIEPFVMSAHEANELLHLIYWLEGYERGNDGGFVPGRVTLTMLYRTLIRE